MSGRPSIGELLGGWTLDPGLLLSAAVALAAYAWGAVRARRWPAQRGACFALGVAASLLALCSGLDAWSERLLSVHMVQHLLLTLVAAPLLVAGAPLALALRALPHGGARRLARALRSRPARALTHPLVTWSLLPALLLATHLTGIFELTLRDPAAHAAEHLAYLAAAVLFWLPVLGAEPLPRRPGPVGQLLYLLLGMPAMAAAGVLLTIDTSVRYPAYLAPARALGVDALADQHAAGTIMWVAGSVLAAALTVAAVWAALEREERRAVAREARQPLALLLAVVLAIGPALAAQPPAARAASPLPAQGQLLFQGSCASCHGLSGRGVPGRGPSLAGAGAQAADFYLRTGRMPLADPGDAPVRSHPLFSPPQIRALTAYVAALSHGPPIPRVDLARSSLAAGRRAFTDHCAGCHQVVARGGIVTGAIAPPLQQATPTQVAEAVRIGPYLMPRFTRRQIDDRTLADIARYVEWTKHPDDAGGWSIGNIGPIPEGLIAWFIGLLALLIVIRLIGERSPR
ncbi:MAG: cytochrome c oxidase assembly protein [Actinobacteria bacterium]|nr:cytochrome c oxidase assembly protein [Actinomycetota bacterium]